MKRKGPASLRGSLIARKGEASSAGGTNDIQQLRGTLTDASNGRPPVSVPTPPGVVEGRLGYRLQADPRGAQPLAVESRTAQVPLVDTPQRDDHGADSLRDYRPAFELSPVSERRDGAAAACVAAAPDGHSRQAAAERSRNDGVNARLPTKAATAVGRRADANGVNNANGADVPRPSDGEVGAPQSTLRRGVRQGDVVRARPEAAVNSANHGRRRSGGARGHRQRGRSRSRVGRMALFATVVLLAVGVGYYGRLGAPQSMMQAVQETLIDAFGSAAPLLAEAVGVSEGALVDKVEDSPVTAGADVRPETVPDLPTAAADLRSNDVTDNASVQPGTVAVRRGEPSTASLPSLSTKVALGPVREDVPAVALAAARTDLKAGVLLNPAAADKLPIPLTPSSAVATNDTLPPTGLPLANEPQPVKTARLEAPAGLAVPSDVAFPPKAVVVEAPLSNEAALSESEAGVRLGVLSGRAAIPISRPRDLARREAGDVPGPAVLSSGGAYAVQLASYRSSKLAADAAAKLSERHLELLGSGAARVEPGPNGLYRVMSMRMERRGDAVSLCDRLKTLGQDCLVVQR